MHQQRLVGGLAALAVLLLLPLPLNSGAAQASPAASAPVGLAARARFGAVATAPAQPTVLGDAPPATPPALAVADAARARRARHARARHSAPARLVAFARRQLGVPYVYGGASHSGFDCSGLTMYVYRHLGISLPHGATAQAGLGHAVSLHSLRPGDLVFWGGGGYYSHVALYAGQGRIIGAPHTGTVVQYQHLSGASAARRLLPAA